jgi:site-specific recombinase XerD
MEHFPRNHCAFPRPPVDRLYTASRTRGNTFPIQVIDIDWGSLITKRPIILATVENMPNYLLYPEVITLLEQEAHPTYRLIMDLMWTLGARVSEVLALRPIDFIDDGYDVGVILHSLKQGGGRPTNSQKERYPRRYIPIKEPLLIDRLNTYLAEHPCRKNRRMFTMCRQTVNRHINSLVDRIGQMPVPISANTFRHSFAVHLMLHGRPLKYISQLLGHKSIESTEIYTNVLNSDSRHFLEGIDFH